MAQIHGGFHMQSNVHKLDRRDEAPITEPIAIIDTFATGVARIEEVAPNLYRLVLVSEQQAAYDSGRERVVVAKIVCTGEMLAALTVATADKTKAPELLSHMAPVTALAN